ncbi:MAG: DUF4301 family protein [Flavobacteriales bacterium]
MNFTKQDIAQIEKQGLTINEVFKQLKTFSEGIPFANIVTAGTIDNGIEQILKKDEKKYIQLYEKKTTQLDIIKFVPASGAATRMFQFLHEFLENYDPTEELYLEYIKRTNNTQIPLFINSLEQFAFINPLRKKIRKRYPNYKHNKKGERLRMLIKALLDKKGLHYSQLPKGLILFHPYTKYSRTAFEEQLFETTFYATHKNSTHTHFTFTENHVSLFKSEFKKINKRLAHKTKVEFLISYSFQDKSTNTIAVDLHNNPIRDHHNNLVFRPSGHGALIKNLNEIDADIVFIKNIDNVIIQQHVEKIAYHKKILAGKMLWLQKQLFSYLKLIDEDKLTDKKLKELQTFLFKELNIRHITNDLFLIKTLLNRPLRVCGVVKNTGAPGGGPFWVKGTFGANSLQIVEMAQIDPNDTHKQALVKKATHFNPVDIVCGIKNYKGEKFDLLQFTDPKSGIITQKSFEGKPIKALEYPGLWNGAMANWNSAFVEVPLITFNPVKTVNDLLKKEHQPNA